DDGQREIEKRHGFAGARRALARETEERHDSLGARRALGGVGGHVGAPHVMFDLKIEGATVIDGTGAAGSRLDVGVTDEMISALGDLSRERAGTTLNATGKVLTPGFIDMHSHSDWRLWANRRAESKIRQGVTTEVVGNCGFSPA